MLSKVEIKCSFEKLSSLNLYFSFSPMVRSLSFKVLTLVVSFSNIRIFCCICSLIASLVLANSPALKSSKVAPETPASVAIFTRDVLKSATLVFAEERRPWILPSSSETSPRELPFARVTIFSIVSSIES